MNPFPILTQYQSELGYRLEPAAVDQLRRLRELLLDWNRRFNLTRVTDPVEIETRLYLDSLAMLRLVRRSTPSSVTTSTIKLVDIGTGAGFPGLPLKIVDPDISVVLIESTAKKVGFLHEAIRVLGLSDVTAVHGRAEELAHQDQYRAKFDVVTARAVAKLPALIEICMPFCRAGGRGIFPKGRDIDDEISDASRAAEQLRCKILGSETMMVPELSGTSYVIVEQVARPPAQYPRRPGIPTKDPL